MGAIGFSGRRHKEGGMTFFFPLLSAGWDDALRRVRKLILAQKLSRASGSESLGQCSGNVEGK